MADYPEGMTLRIVTQGRVTGREHVATTWFARTDDAVYVAARHGMHSDWLRNALAAACVELRRRRASWPARATLVDDRDEVAHAVDAFADKYRRYPAVVEVWRADPPTFVRFQLLP